HKVLGARAVRFRDRTVYAFPRISDELRRHRPDVIVSGGFSIPSFQAYGYSARSGTAFVLYNEGTVHAERDAHWLQERARRYLCRRAQAAVTPSTEGKKRFVRLGMSSDSCFVAPYALDVAGRPLASDRSGPARLLFAGKLIDAKGLPHILHALARLGHWDWHLTIAGW